MTYNNSTEGPVYLDMKSSPEAQRMKITMQEFEEFEKEFLFQQIANPSYRLGQAFINAFSKISNNIESDGDIGYMRWQELWECNNRKRVLELIDWYVIK